MTRPAIANETLKRDPCSNKIQNMLALAKKAACHDVTFKLNPWNPQKQYPDCLFTDQKLHRKVIACT